MEVRKEDDSPKKKPIAGSPSILYFIGNIPSIATNYQVISHFQKRKFHGGEVVDDEYQSVGPNSALLLFENAAQVSELEQIDHVIEDQQLHLYPLVKEHVSLVLSGSQFVQNLITDSMKKLPNTDKETLQLTTSNGSVVITGNWLSIQQFRQRFQESMFHELGKSDSKLFSSLFVDSRETTESSLNTKNEPGLEDAKDEVEADDHPSSDGRTTAKGSSLNPDVLALMKKTGAYEHPALSYDVESATISIDCDDATKKEKIEEELCNAYREIMLGGRLREYRFPVDDAQQAKDMIDECDKTFNHTYFKYDLERKDIHCFSTDARQMQNVRKRLSNMKKHPEASDGPNVKSEFINLPKFSRKVTIKLGNIVEEEADVIVNAANDRLMHGGGVAAAINKASLGAVQEVSSKLIEQTGPLPTGEAVVTQAGGQLKCKFVVHAVGPIANQHKDQCGPLLHSACVNSMLIAQRNQAKSISFPPISSGIYGVSKELVANVMLSSLCSYNCHDSKLLNDVRIVIIDEPTFKVFLDVFYKEKRNLELLPGLIDTTIVTTPTQPTKESLFKRSSSFPGSYTETRRSAFIDLPELSRRVTLKLGDLVQEEVDVIVNAANNNLQHVGNVADAINKASGGEVQKTSDILIKQGKQLKTGEAVATGAGGNLKCDLVVHAVGPMASHHKSAQLLKDACTNALTIAQSFKVKSISFPPIGSGYCQMSAEVVAQVMISTLCEYKCATIGTLSDVRIVVIDKPTFEVFLSVFDKNRQKLADHVSLATNTTAVLKPATFHHQPVGNYFQSPLPGHAIRFPGQPLYSQAVVQQPRAFGEVQPHSPETQIAGSPPADVNNSSPTVTHPHPMWSGAQHTPTTTSSPMPTQSHIVTTESSGNFKGRNADSGDSSKTAAGRNTGLEGEDQMHEKGKAKVDGQSSKQPFEDLMMDAKKDIGKLPNLNGNADDKDHNEKEDSNKIGNKVAMEHPASSTTTGAGASTTKKNSSPTLQQPKKLGSSDSKSDQPNVPPKQDSAITVPPAATHRLKLDDSLMEDDNEGDNSKKGVDSKADECPICYDQLKDKAISKCRHCKQGFCEECLETALKYKPYCPTCTVALRAITGAQPKNGTMRTTILRESLPGYPDHCTIEIYYDIPNGIQGPEHPNPGERYQGTLRVAYLPDSQEGKKVARLLRKAFDARLVFTVGTSHTTGATNAVVWNDIHHKTNKSGGTQSYGYPDPTYLNRVLEELAAKGIKE